MAPHSLADLGAEVELQGPQPGWPDAQEGHEARRADLHRLTIVAVAQHIGVPSGSTGMAVIVNGSDRDRASDQDWSGAVRDITTPCS